ncbi:MAG TPA: TIGR00730 family Rossman fold protein [Bauldia sp.]|nr:TIGR00730 family Rossman fold protein [Bauldia sp.]
MPDNEAQRAAQSYVLPAFDNDYIMRDSMRGVRFLLEYSKAEELLRAWGVRSTVVVFGSARVMEGGSGDPSATTSRLPPPPARPRPGHDSARWYDEARALGRIVSERGGALTSNGGLRDNVIATGGGPGIMEAANRGARDAGAPSIGFNIELPHEQEPNAYSTPDLTFQFHYFAMRKMHFAMRASALAVFPGGFGTFDELFELVTLVQTGKMKKIPIVCLGRSYWSKVINIPLMVEEGFISQEEAGLLDYADDAEEAWDVLVGHGLTIPPARGAEPRKDVAP